MFVDPSAASTMPRNVGPLMSASYHNHNYLTSHYAAAAAGRPLSPQPQQDGFDSSGEEVTSPNGESVSRTKQHRQHRSLPRELLSSCSSCGSPAASALFGYRRHADLTGNLLIGSDANGNDILTSRRDTRGRPVMDNSASRVLSLDSAAGGGSGNNGGSSSGGGGSGLVRHSTGGSQSPTRKLSLGSSDNVSRPNAGGCVRATAELRRVVHEPNGALHIRTREVPSCRDIRDILLQIRDSLSEADLKALPPPPFHPVVVDNNRPKVKEPSPPPPLPAEKPPTPEPQPPKPNVATNGHLNVTPILVLPPHEDKQVDDCVAHPASEDGAVGDCCPSEPPVSTSSRSASFESCRRHCHSLPNADDIGNDDDDSGCCKHPGVCRRRSNVRFADEVGMNLNTFVMIPPRRRPDRCSSPVVPATSPEPSEATPSPVTLAAAAAGSNGLYSPLPEYLLPQYLLSVDPGFTMAAERRAPRQRRVSQETGPATGPAASECSGACGKTQHPLTLNISASQQSTAEDTISVSDEAEQTAEASSCPQLAANPPAVPPAHQETFHLCFDQPAANLKRFCEKLDAQLVCLENVRVEDYEARHNNVASNNTTGSPTACSCPRPSSPTSPVSAPTSVTLSAHSVILLSIKVKNVDPEKRVFARCTDNGWQTYADLPAQFVGGVDNLGREFDRFCVAVRRPSTDRPAPETADASKPAAVVEFALCYQVNGHTYWDNNDLANYRIEWFDGPIPALF